MLAVVQGERMVINVVGFYEEQARLPSIAHMTALAPAARYHLERPRTNDSPERFRFFERAACEINPAGCTPGWQGSGVVHVSG
jgi:hypothetical protein